MLAYFLLFTTNSLLVIVGDGFKYSFLTVYIIEILITLIVLPFLIRLSGQLFIQTQQCYKIIKNASDPEEHRPYYDHYRIMFCLLFVMLMTSVFNLIKAFYLIKPFFLYYVEPISLNLVLNFWFSFQDAIISFGLLAMLQVMYFFQEKKKKFGRYFTLPILRFFWVLFIESGLLIILISFENPITIEWGGTPSTISYIVYYFLFLKDSIFFAFSILICLMRFLLIFRFAKECNDIVKKLIDGILSDNNLRNAMGHERVENIYRATVLFRYLSWGNFILAMLFSIPPSIESAYSFFYSQPPHEYSDYFFSSVLFNELILFLTNILYAIFFLILWKFLFDKSKKVKFRGYSHYSESGNLQTQETVPILNPIAFTGMKIQKILLRYYSIVISCITVIMVGFITPLAVNGWSSLLFVHPGDYYRLKYTNLYQAMESCSEVTAEVYYPPYYAPFDCDFTYFATIEDSSSFLYQNYSMQLSNYSEEGNVLWVPPNTTVTRLKTVYSLNISSIIQTDIPCMTPNERSIALGGRFVIFDCVIPEYNYTNFIANCSNTDQCQSFHKSISTSMMINLTIDSSDYYATSNLIRQTYNLSNLSNVEPVMGIWKSENDFDWQKYDLLLNNNPSIYHYDTCVIKFKCILPPYIGIIVAIFTIFSVPVYLMVSVILIHRH